MEAIQSFDFSVLNAIQDSLRCTFLDSFAVILSYITTSGILWIALAVVLLFFRKTRAERRGTCVQMETARFPAVENKRMVILFF